jgi:hypothetical protein
MQTKRFLIAGLVLIALLGAAVWFGRGTWETARIGTAYVAKQTCSCLFVAGRKPESCRTDYDPAALARLKVEPAASSVKVSALGGLVASTAQFDAGFGCHPVN